MDSPRCNRHVTLGPLGFPCLCRCDCPARHHNLSRYLCDPCEKHSKDGVEHGEKEL